MSDAYEDEDTLSLDDVEEMEDEQDSDDPTDHLEDSFDDLDSESWDEMYGTGREEELEVDPWELG